MLDPVGSCHTISAAEPCGGLGNKPETIFMSHSTSTSYFHADASIRTGR